MRLYLQQRPSAGEAPKYVQLSLEQEGTLKPLTLVAVQGTLDPSGGPGTLVVRTTGIYVMPDDPLAERIRAFRAK